MTRRTFNKILLLTIFTKQLLSAKNTAVIKGIEQCFPCESMPCISECPEQAIFFNHTHSDSNGYTQSNAGIYEDDCTCCGACKSVCPFDNISCSG